MIFAAPALASVPASEAAPTGQAGEAAETRILLPLLLRAGNNPTDPTSRPGSPTPTTTELATATITPWPLPTSIDVLPPGAASYDLLAQAGGWSHAVAAADDLVYMGVGSRLLVVEAEDPSALEPVANYQLRGLVEQIVIRGDRLYVAAASGGLFVLDASDPRALRLLSHLPALSSSLELALAGDIGYLAEGLDGLHVLDLSDPRDPRQIGRIESKGVSLAVSVDEGDQLLGLADGNAGLRIFDLSDRRAPMELATYREQFEILDVELAGGAGYVIEDGQTLLVVDLRTPDRPRRTMSRDLVWGCCSWDMHLGQDRLSILSIGTLLIFDVRSPLAPVQARRIELDSLAGIAESLDVVGNRVHLVGWSGLQIIDPLADDARLELGRLGIERVRRAIIAAGKTLFAGDLRFDLSTPTAPKRLPDAAALPGRMLAASDDWLIATTHSRTFEWPVEIVIHDVTDPQALRAMGSFTVTGNPMLMDFRQDGRAALASMPFCPVLHAVDLSDPEQPSLRGMTRLPNNPTALFMRGTEVIVGMDAGHCDVLGPGPGRLSIYDLADPDSIRALGTVTVPVGIQDLAISGDHAFAAAWTDGVYVLDVSGAMSPTLVSRVPLPGLARAVEIIGDRLFVDMVEPAAVGDLAFLPWRNHWGRVLVVDIANPLEPKVIDALPVGASGGLLAYRGTLWHSADESGISAWGQHRTDR